MTWPRRVTYGLWAVSAALLVLAVIAVRDKGDPAGAWVVGGVVLCSAIPFTAGHLVTRRAVLDRAHRSARTGWVRG